MFKLWSNRFFKNDLNISKPFILPKSLWKEIGILMQNNRKNMALDFEKPPRNIFKHNARYK
ncbi:15220_t:CDS:1, partial [Funneliformis geosporum]